MGETIFIKPGYMEKCKIEISDRIEYFEKNIMDLNNKIIIMIQDSFGNEYIFKNGFPVGWKNDMGVTIIWFLQMSNNTILTRVKILYIKP